MIVATSSRGAGARFGLLSVAAFTVLFARAYSLDAAKQPSLTAIELYAGASGPAYLQMTSFLVNSKALVRVCKSGTKINRSDYSKLQRAYLAPGATIEEQPNGELLLKQGDTASCVVADDLKLDKGGALLPAELTAKAMITGVVLPGGSEAITAPPQFKPGVKIMIVEAPSKELAEFLRADHTPSIPLWQDFLSGFPNSAHANDAKQSLAALFVRDGESNLEAYRNSPKAPPRSYAQLNKAEQRAEQALSTAPGLKAASDLQDAAHAEASKLVTEGRDEIHLYKQAIVNRTSGYSHLLAAEDLANECREFDANFAAAATFEGEARSNAEALEKSLNSGGSLLAAKKDDGAFAAVEPYASFAGEIPRVAAIVNSTLQFHVDRARKAADDKDWETAVAEYRHALAVKSTKAVADSLKDAEDQWEAAKNQKAADTARIQSQALEQQRDFVHAYWALANLTPPQRALVSADIERLTPLYIESAPDAAATIQAAHDPIGGRADELEIQRAYNYLDRASLLSQDASLKDKADALGDKLSEYDLEQARRLLQKPRGSGACLAWYFLQKALQYKASNLDQIRDEITRARPAYQTRSRLSIKVTFRDETSRRDSPGFADQLGDAIASELEGSGFPGTVIRNGENPEFEPNFELIGDVLDHSPSKVPTSEPRLSHYRAGEQNVPNPEWNSKNREYESAQEDLQTLQQGLPAVYARGKKKEVDELGTKIAAAKKQISDLHVQLDALPKEVAQDIVKPYNYTEKTVAVSAIVQLRFRIRDFFGNQVVDATQQDGKKSKKFVLIENAKAEDLDGIKDQGTDPDETQLLLDVEKETINALTKSVMEKTAGLPDIVFEKAHKQEEEEDLEGAAESYILYLNATPASETAKRRQAERFLQEKFNIRWPSDGAAPE